ncbi:MAG: translocation/assembly module TamB domain-containing protein, partial [Fibrobacter sp.]|nr:translocation/assembly module TamB domain-containing protein [Fibrobacter sp.]
LSNVNNSWNMDGEFIAHTDNIGHKLLEIKTNSADLSGTLSGTLKSPQTSFTLSVQNIHFNSEKILSFYGSGIFKNDTLTIDTSNAIFDNNGFIRLSGFIPVQKLTSFPIPLIRYSIRNVPLSIFNLFFPLLVIRSGTVTGNGVFTNKNGKNTSYGKLFINNADFNFGQNSNGSGKINGEIRLHNDSLIIESLGGKLGDGDLVMSGHSIFRLNKIPLVNFSIQTKNSYLSVPELIKMNIDTLALTLQTVNNRFSIEGSAALGETSFIRNIRINDIVSKDIVQPDKPETGKSSLTELVDIGIELFLNENLFIDMNLGNLQLDGYVAVSGQLSSPNLIGELRAVDGYIYYLDREFFVTNGIISNYDPQFNPSFDITGNTEVIAFSASEAQTQAYDITISVNGNLDKPTVELESEPPLSKPDIIGVLTLGSTLGAIGSDLANRIGNLVGQEIIGLGTNKLERILNLQSINVSGNIFNATSGKGAEITLSRSFSKRLIFTYTTGFANFLSPKISAVFRLFPYLFLTGATNSNGADIGLRFRTNK